MPRSSKTRAAASNRRSRVSARVGRVRTLDIAVQPIAELQLDTRSYRVASFFPGARIMAHWTFDMPVMQFLADHRTFLLTKFFLFATFIGEADGYILVITLIYVMFDKTLAVRLSVLVLLTMCLNHVLKIIIEESPALHPRRHLSQEMGGISGQRERTCDGILDTLWSRDGRFVLLLLSLRIGRKSIRKSLSCRGDSSHRTFAPLPGCPLSRGRSRLVG